MNKLMAVGAVVAGLAWLLPDQTTMAYCLPTIAQNVLRQRSRQRFGDIARGGSPARVPPLIDIRALLEWEIN